MPRTDRSTTRRSRVGSRRGWAAIGTAMTTLLVVGPAPAAMATPVCTAASPGGFTPCLGRVFPEAKDTRAYVQYTPDPATGKSEFLVGLAELERLYPRYVDVFTLDEAVNDPRAVSPGPDRKRAGETGDTNDGRKILVVKLTDSMVPDAGKETLAFSLSVHGNERGGLEGGLRTVEDLAKAAGTAGPAGVIVDGIANYTSTTDKAPAFHSYGVADVLAKEAVYVTAFNVDGWAVGDVTAVPTSAYARGNSIGTDLNRQMPTVGSINTSRNPLTENEMKFGLALLERISAQGVNGKMAYGADVHGEITSRAYVDIMYPAGQFDSVKHRQLMSIAERTKSVVDATLYAGIIDQVEETVGGGNGAEGVDEYLPPGVVRDNAGNTITVKPAHWATVWDTLGYTDSGFIGDYLATDLAVTGMDYEIFLNHTVPDKTWNVFLQENHINASRAIIKTAMAYALTQDQEFNTGNVTVDTVGRAGYVVDADTVSSADENGSGRSPGPATTPGRGANGLPVEQRPYDADRMRFFRDTDRLMGAKPFVAVGAADVASNAPAFLALDSLVLADNPLPADHLGRPVDAAAYYANLAAWVRGGGNLVLTDRALSALASMGVLPASAVSNIKVYQPYSDITDFSHPLARGLRPNARQLVEAPILGYGIGNTASPVTVVAQAPFTEAGGQVVGTTGANRVSLGRLPLGSGQVTLVGAALPTQTEDLDHRYGLRDYALTYSGLYVMENAVRYDRDGAGPDPVVPETPLPVLLPLLALLAAAGLIRLRRRRAA